MMDTIHIGMPFTHRQSKESYHDMSHRNTYAVSQVHGGRVFFIDDVGALQTVTIATFNRDFQQVLDFQEDDVMEMVVANDGSIAAFRDMTVGKRYTITRTSTTMGEWVDDEGDGCSATYRELTRHMIVVKRGDEIMGEVDPVETPKRTVLEMQIFQALMVARGQAVSDEEAETLLGILDSIMLMRGEK